jgi:acetylornithine aminotransferase
VASSCAIRYKEPPPTAGRLQPGGNHLACARRPGRAQSRETETCWPATTRLGDYLQVLAHAGAEEITDRGLMSGHQMRLPHQEIRDKLLAEHHILLAAYHPLVLRLLPPLNARWLTGFFAGAGAR